MLFQKINLVLYKETCDSQNVVQLSVNSGYHSYVSHQGTNVKLRVY